MDLTIAGALLASDVPARTITGRLLTYGEQGRTSLGLVSFTPTAPSMPADPRRLRLNAGHDRDRPIGYAQRIDVRDVGVDATFEIARTPAGDAVLAEAAAGLRTGLSVEVDGASIRNGMLVAGTISEVGAVVTPAFPSSTITALVASDAGDEPAPDDEQTDEDVAEGSDNDAGEQPPADDDELEGDEHMPDTTTSSPTPRPATAPDDLRASAHTTPAVLRGAGSVQDFVRLCADAYRTSDRTLLAALANVTYGGAGGIGADVMPPQYLSELWSGRAYERRYVPLIAAGAALTSRTVAGWRWVTRPEVATYAGNKTAVPSNVVDTEPATTAATILAGAHDHDRTFVDFSVPDYWESYWRAMTESYAKKSDLAVLSFLQSSATAFTPGTTPVGADAGTAAVIDGALAVLAAGGVPSFAIVAADVYRGMIMTTQQNRLALFDQSLGLEGGAVDTFRVVPAAVVAPVTTGQVIVGARESASFHELPGVPIRITAEHIAEGGQDTSLFGYFAPVLHNAATLVKCDLVP